MINVQWSMVNAQWSMLNAQCSMVNVQCSMVNVQCSMVNAQWSMFLRISCMSLEKMLYLQLNVGTRRVASDEMAERNEKKISHRHTYL